MSPFVKIFVPSLLFCAFADFYVGVDGKVGGAGVAFYLVME